ncbi:hypothetical protein B6A10_05985 [Flavobacterium sp. L1I52]|uniref:O-antigen ligase-related domain-containing protein n=1 Tax=Flavobacterium pokkalii TaxID=1940408 RepID=A0ABR7UQ16_9FLAO|nr:O-antigen ligase family protein [Flavobacterium pokkalii]MBD0724723.1 hypothetical protein [Flavobacterium pokkalii]
MTANLYNFITVLILLTVIAIGWINIDFFYSQTSFAFYGFCFSALLFTITPIQYDLAHNKPFRFTKPFLAFALWTLYITTQSVFSFADPHYYFYFLVLGLFFYKTDWIFKDTNFNYSLLLKGIAILSFLESGYCLGQCFGLIPSKDALFTVTGTWTNPNVTAIFLALTTPAFLYLFETSVKKIAQLGFVLLLIALVLLECRAAYIGTSIIIVAYYSLKYNFLNWAKNPKNKLTLRTVLVLGVIFLFTVGSKLYYTKKDSADGRSFIWKVATQLALEKPVTGYGYGNFALAYNRYQSQYIQDGKATPAEMQNVARINMPHNEIVQQLVEGGLIGLALMLFFFTSLLIPFKKQIQSKGISVLDLSKNNLYYLSYAAVLGFIAMSMVNTTLVVSPVMALLLLYAAFLNNSQEPLQWGKKILQFTPTKKQQIGIASLLFISGSCLIYFFANMAIADRKNKIAFDLNKQGQYIQALNILKPLEPVLQYDNNYWDNLGLTYLKTKNYTHALDCFKKASAISTELNYHLGAAACYRNLNQNQEAIIEYQKLVLLKPSKFKFRFDLMKLYIKQKDTTNILQTAQGIIDLKPKIPSAKVEYYKKIARKVVFHFSDPEMKKIVKRKKRFLKNSNPYSFLNKESK